MWQLTGHKHAPLLVHWLGELNLASEHGTYGATADQWGPCESSVQQVSLIYAVVGAAVIGAAVGVAAAAMVGAVVGFGAAVGAAVGAVVGAAVGNAVGALVGMAAQSNSAFLKFCVGLLVGTAVGHAVGGVGAEVGAAVGGVGAEVGATVVDAINLWQETEKEPPGLCLPSGQRWHSSTAVVCPPPTEVTIAVLRK